MATGAISESVRYCRIDGPVDALLSAAVQQCGLSGRAYDRILKIARTIADLAASERITAEHVTEAIQCRALDRQCDRRF